MAVQIARTNWIDDDGTGTTGTVLNNAVKTELYNQIDAALAAEEAIAIPSWVPVAYSAGNFFGTGAMNWTVAAGNQIRFAYRLHGKTMTVSFYLDATTLSGTATGEVRLMIPTGATLKGWCTGFLWYQFAATGAPGVIRGLTGNNYLSFLKADLSNFTLGATNVFTGTFDFEIN